MTPTTWYCYLWPFRHSCDVIDIILLAFSLGDRDVIDGECEWVDVVGGSSSSEQHQKEIVDFAESDLGAHPGGGGGRASADVDSTRAAFERPSQHLKVNL